RFSPDGTEIAFRTLIGDTTQIWTMSAQDGHITRHVTDDDFINLSPSWSPDGSHIVYASYRGHNISTLTGTEFDHLTNVDLRNWNIVSADLVTGASGVVATTDHGGAFRPVWSPDGTRIGFISTSDPGQSDIYVVDARGGRARPLQISFLVS